MLDGYSNQAASCSFCFRQFLFVSFYVSMRAFMEELNCEHLVWYVYDEFTSLSTLFAGFS